MWKILPIVALAFSACSSFSINASMCDKIASEPNTMIPEECQNYSEVKAQKAFDKVKKKKESREDIIQFTKDQNDKEN